MPLWRRSRPKAPQQAQDAEDRQELPRGPSCGLRGERIVSAGKEFTRALVVEPLPHAGLSFAVDAAPDERAALARRLDLLALDRLVASGWVRRGAVRGAVVVEGRLDALVTQACVVSLAPVPATLTVDFRRLFVPPAGDAGPREVVVDPLLDEPEPLPGREIDLGEIIAEELALALDPYPRAAPCAPLVSAAAGDSARSAAAQTRRRVV